MRVKPSKIQEKNMIFLFPFHYFVVTSECDIFPPVRTADFTLQGRDLFFSASVLMKPCQSLLPLPSVSQLATSAPITAAHGQSP